MLTASVLSQTPPWTFLLPKHIRLTKPTYLGRLYIIISTVRMYYNTENLSRISGAVCSFEGAILDCVLRPWNLDRIYEAQSVEAKMAVIFEVVPTFALERTTPS